MTKNLDALTECLDCGMVQRYPRVKSGALVTCTRCGAVLGRGQRSGVKLSLVCALVGLVLMAFGLTQPAGSLTIQGGRFAEVDLTQGMDLLTERGTWELAVAVAFTLAVMPVLRLLSIVVITLCALRGRAPRWAKTLYVKMRKYSEWAMVDVFLLGAMIALVRLQSWGYVWFGPALLAFTGAALCLLAIDVLLDRQDLWRRLSPSPWDGDEPGPPTPTGCQYCGRLVRRRSGQRCPRCEQTLRRRKPHSLPRTWAFVVGAALLLLPANVLPVMTVSKMGAGGPDTILSGTIELSQHGLWGLATIVFVASIVVPVLKLASLAVLLVMTQRGATGALQFRTRLYRFVATIGRWSMIDIFATMTLVAVGRFGWFGYVWPGAGAVAFCAVVFLTMIAAESFEPRLMWDVAGRNGPVRSTVPAPDRRVAT